MQWDSHTKNRDTAPANVPGAEYYGLLEKLPAAAYTCDADGLITYFNRRAVEVWGRAPKLNDPEDRFCGSFRLFSPEGKPLRHDECWMALALRDDRDYDTREIVIERADGSRITVLAHAHPLHDTDGNLVGAANVLLDITERKVWEQAQGRLAAIIESADDAIIGKDLNGIITDWNKGAENLFGYSAREAIGQPIGMLIPADRQDEEPEILGRIQRGEAMEHYETIRRRKDGTLLAISLSVSPIRNAQGRIIGASKIARDIRERQKLEKALVDADRRKDEFLAMLSHELRNPLATIRNSVQLLRLDPGRAMQEKVLAPLERQVGTLARLVDDLMDVSRVTMGRVRLQRTDVPVNRILRDAASTMRREMIDGGHAFTVSKADPDLMVNVDAMRLEQVVTNLLTNASKYTPEGGRIELAAERDGDDAVISVRDSGIGIQPEVLPEVFDLFSQGTTALDRSKGGLGIGLALVKYLVEMHGGSVTAASGGPGAGSEFVVRLPAVVSATSTGNEERPAAGSTAAGRPSLRILVVDDNRDSADLQATLLEHIGHEVRTAYEGNGALQAAAEFQPDVILLDIGLPQMDGYEVAYRIRQEPTLGGVVMIAMTGYGQSEDMQRTKAAGFDHHMLKPAEFAELQRLLAHISPR